MIFGVGEVQKSMIFNKGEVMKGVIKGANDEDKGTIFNKGEVAKDVIEGAMSEDKGMIFNKGEVTKGLFFGEVAKGVIEGANDEDNGMILNKGEVEGFDFFVLKRELEAKYKKGVRQCSFGAEGVHDGNGLFDELLEVDPEEFDKVEEGFVERFLAEHCVELEKASFRGGGDAMGPSARRMEAKGSTLHWLACERYRNGSRGSFLKSSAKGTNL